MSTGVYIHARPNTEDASGIFYIGKGTKHRSRSFTDARNPHYRNVVAKHGKKNIQVLYIECQSEQDAFNLEIELIGMLKWMGIELVNRTSGGEGCGSGEQHWTKKSPHLVKRGPEHKNFGKTASEETKEKNRLAHLGKPTWNKGVHDINWMNDGNVARMIRRKDHQKFLDDGWKFGRKVA